MNIAKQRIRYIISDLIATALGWFCFYVYRFDLTAHNDFATLQDFLLNQNVLLNLCITPLLWLCLYSLSGYYAKPYFKNQLEELQKTFITVLAGSLIFFFLYVIDDVPLFDYDSIELSSINHVPSSVYLQILLTMIVYVLLPVYICRFLITSTTNKKIRKGLLTFNTTVIESPKSASMQRESGSALPDAFILEPEVRVPKNVFRMVYELMPLGRPILIKADANDMLSGQVRTSSLTSVPMIEYGSSKLSAFQNNAKRLFDIIGSLIALIICSPLLLVIAIMVKQDSEGPVIYRQERLGKCARPFTILKFRTMCTDAEKDSPMLSVKGDRRVTRIGRMMRKYRLDELPQLWNILVGDMSFVGPRPERKFYVDQIINIAPHYAKLLQVRPGLSSWGMVKYGYASDTFQMVERMRYDLMYIDNMSPALDLKIMAYTIKTVVTGKGI